MPKNDEVDSTDVVVLLYPSHLFPVISVPAPEHWLADPHMKSGCFLVRKPTRACAYPSAGSLSPSSLITNML